MDLTIQAQPAMPVSLAWITEKAGGLCPRHGQDQVGSTDDDPGLIGFHPGQIGWVVRIFSRHACHQKITRFENEGQTKTLLGGCRRYLEAGGLRWSSKKAGFLADKPSQKRMRDYCPHWKMLLPAEKGMQHLRFNTLQESGAAGCCLEKGKGATHVSR